MIPPMLLRQRYVCDYEAGPRPVPPPSTAYRIAKPVLMPLSVLACVVTDEPLIALTYDDGPDPQTTPAVLDALGEHGLPATFFVLAEQAIAHPQVVRRIVEAGHELALHGWDHRRLSMLPLREALASVRRAREAVEQISGRPLTWFRPPYGAQTVPLALGVRAMGLDIVLWSAWARDWHDEPTAVLADRALAAAHPGGILLLHDAPAGIAAGPDGVRTLPTFSRAGLTSRLIEGLRSTGYRFETVSGLVEAATPGRTPWWESRRQARERGSTGWG